MFGGIGSGIIALKLNSIGIKKIIHVDHDKVATHVHRWNHDPNYKKYFNNNDTEIYNINNDTDDIEHIYEYERFEDIQKNISKFLQEHGRK